ncbi:hypothetical protein N9459_04250 [Flavobacteriaceae bacterium]|nr:hypothetical protein [Flavobacteriaceae bacterium]
MAEYTRDIKQLQKTASQQPSFAAPSQSVAGDVVNLIGTGLDFYSKNKAQGKLDAIAKSQKERGTLVTQEILGLREFEQELQANPNMSKTEYNSRINNRLRSLPSDVALEVLAGKNKLTGQTSAQVGNQIDSSRKASREQEEATKQEGLAFATQVLKINPNDAATATPEQFQAWADKSGVMQRQIDIQKQIIEVSDDVTAPVIEIARTIFIEDVNSQLATIRELQRAGNVEGSTEAGKSLRNSVMQMINNAPSQIQAMLPQDKKQYYDPKLTTILTKEMSSMLESSTVKDVLSGKEVNESMMQGAEILINSRLTPYFLKLSDKVAKGDVSPQVMDDYKNITEWVSNKNITGLSFGDTTMENTILRANGLVPLADKKKGGSDDPVVVKEQEDNQSQTNIKIMSEFLNNASTALKNLKKEGVEILNNHTKAYIVDKLDRDKELNSADIAWIESSLTYGNTGDIENRGKGASKAMLQAPISLLATADYSKIKPAIDKATANGVDIVSALTSSLDNHIKNNVKNAFTDLMGAATSGMMGGPKTGISKAGERGLTASGTYNLRDVVNLHNDNGKLVFKYKAGMLGQSTDASMIGNLRRLNNSVVVLNDYVKAMSNVTETEEGLVADEIRGLLGKYVNIPLPEDTQPTQKKK